MAIGSYLASLLLAAGARRKLPCFRGPGLIIVSPVSFRSLEIDWNTAAAPGSAILVD